MKNLAILIFVFNSSVSFGQPDPAWFYPKKIEEITGQLKSNPSDYELIWRRLELKVALLTQNAEQFNNPFIDYPNAITCKKINCDEYSQDFEKLYDATFISKKFVLSPFSYYINRIEFYAHTLQIDKAYDDLVYLKKYIPIPEGWNAHVEYFFFKIYVLKKDYNKALENINTILEKEKHLNRVYDDVNNKYHDKVALFIYFNKKDELITYTKQNLKNSFDIYFNNEGQSEWERDRMKRSSCSYLIMLVHYLKKYNHHDLPLYEKIYTQLCFQVNENHITINPGLSDEELKSIVSEIW